MAIPIFGDQFDNAVRVEDRGLGIAEWDKDLLKDGNYVLARIKNALGKK